MSAREAPRGPRDCGHDAGAYVLGALSPDEVEAFRRHLKGCISCRDEVAALGSVVEALPMAAPQLAVNRALRRRVMADVRAARRATDRERGRSRRFGRRRVDPRGALAAVLAAAAIAGLVVGLSSTGSNHTRTVAASAVGWAGTAVVQVEGARAQLIVRDMPAPPPGHIYQVWLKRAAAGAPIATSALFSVTAGGGAVVGVPGDVRGVREVLVTPERLGGSQRPTHTPVIIARLA